MAKSPKNETRRVVVKPKTGRGARTTVRRLGGLELTAANARAMEASRKIGRPLSRDGEPEMRLAMGGRTVNPITVPNFAGLDLITANSTALVTPVVLSYYNTLGAPVSAPPQDQWRDWTVVQNMPPTLAGTQIMPGGQVGVMIAFM